MNGAWDILGVASDSDRDTVRRAYARQLRVTNPEDDPEGFKRLRAAYEAALEHLVWVERWGAEPDLAEHVVVLDQEQFDALIGQDVRAPVFHSEPSMEPPLSAGGPEAGEIGTLLAERDAERAQLHAAMNTLDDALRGAWRASDDELEALFNDVLAAPAVAEIALQTEVEAWAADLIAATIPRSDAILLQATTRFGWSGETQRGQSYAIAACLARIDEWRLIEELGHHRNPLNAAWRSLTRAPGGWLFWRLDALRPGVASGVETLLGRRGDVTPGLVFSFKPASVVRWERLLDRPHVTVSMLAAAPFAALIAFVTGASLNPDKQATLPVAAGLWATLAAALIAPVLLFALHGVRHAADRRGLSGWTRDGWAFGYVALGAVAVALPVSPWSVAAFGTAAVLVWAWMTATTRPPSRADLSAHWKAIWLPVALFGVVGLFGLLAVPVPHALIQCGMLVLFVLLRLGGWPTAVTALERPLAHGAVPTLVVFGLAVAGVLLLPVGALVLISAATRDVAAGAAATALFGVAGHSWFYAATLGVLALQPVLAAAQDLGGTAASVARVMRVVLLAGLGAALVVAFDSLPPRPAAMVTPAPVLSATAPGTLRGEIVAALGERDTDRALAVLSDRQPGFGPIAEGNPALYRDLRTVIGDGVHGRVRPEDTADVVTAMLAERYRERLPTTNDSLVREEFAIQLARLKALQRVSDAACIAPRTTLDELPLAEAVRQRQTAQALNVVSNPLSKVTGRPLAGLTPAALDTRAAALAQVGPPEYRADLAGSHGEQRQCSAMIARSRVLAGDVYDSDPLLGPTRRAELLRTAGAKPLN